MIYNCVIIVYLYIEFKSTVNMSGWDSEGDRQGVGRGRGRSRSQKFGMEFTMLRILYIHFEKK